MSDDPKYTRFEPPSDGRMWIVDGAHCLQGDLCASQQEAEIWRKGMQKTLMENKAKTGSKITDPTCRVVELHVQTAEARAEQMRKLAKVIENAHFHSNYEQAYAAGEIAEILGLDERWYYEACGMDPDEAMAEGYGKFTLGDVTDA